MKRKEVIALLTKVRSAERRRTDLAIAVMQARVEAVETKLKEQQTASSKATHPASIPLNPSDWYSKGGVVTAIPKRRTKSVHFKLPAHFGTQSFAVSEHELDQVKELGLNFAIAVLHEKPQPWFAMLLEPTTYSGTVPDLHRRLNDIFKGRFAFYVEVTYVD